MFFNPDVFSRESLIISISRQAGILNLLDN